MYPVFFLEKGQWVESYVSLSENKDDKTEIILTEGYDKLSSDIWIGNSGASIHMASSMEGLYNTKECKIPVQFGNKSKLYPTKVGKCRGVAISKDGKKTPILRNDVKYLPGLHYNLLSLSKAKKVFELKGASDQLTLNYKNLRYHFNHKIKSGSGILYGLQILTPTNNKSAGSEAN